METKSFGAGLVAILMIAIAAIGWIFVYENEPKPCVPFAQKDVPDESNSNWELLGQKDLYDSKNVSWFYEETYEHKRAVGLRLNVVNYFGNRAYKAWYCGNNPTDWSLAIYKDNAWKVFLKDKGSFTVSFVTHLDPHSNPAKQTITVIDANDQKTELIIIRHPN